jgi:hypothetical protein
MAEREQANLQREADEERPWTMRSEERSERLERFKQGEVDRWGGEVDVTTPMADFYFRASPSPSQPGGELTSLGGPRRHARNGE